MNLGIKSKMNTTFLTPLVRFTFVWMQNMTSCNVSICRLYINTGNNKLHRFMCICLFFLFLRMSCNIESASHPAGGSTLLHKNDPDTLTM